MLIECIIDNNIRVVAQRYKLRQMIHDYSLISIFLHCFYLPLSIYRQSIRYCLQNDLISRSQQQQPVPLRVVGAKKVDQVK